MSQQYHHPSQPQISTGHMQPPPPTPPLSSAPPHMSVQAHPVGPLVTGPPVFVPQMNTDPPPQPSQISQHSLPNVSSSTSVHLSQPASSFSSSSNHHHLLSSSSYASYPSICRPYLPLSSSSPTLSSPSNFVVPQSLCSPLTSLTSLSSSVSLSSPSSVSPALSSNYSASLPAPLSYSPPEMHSNSYSRSIATSVYNTATQSATDLINVQVFHAHTYTDQSNAHTKTI